MVGGRRPHAGRCTRPRLCLGLRGAEQARMEVTSDSHGAAAIFSGARGSCPWGEVSARGLGGLSWLCT